MKRSLLITIVIAAALALATSALAGGPPGGAKGKSNRASQTVVCKDASWNEVFPCDLGYGTGNAFGEIKYDTSSAGGFETMHLILHGLQANTWYLVTMQDPTGADQFSTNAARCLFGVKGTSTGFEFCDVALVKTNNGGNVNALIPTDSGLTGAGAPVCASGNVPALTTAPDLGAGSYTGITMVVKNVGVGGDGTTPSCGALIAGGVAELFERGALPNFTAP